MDRVSFRACGRVLLTERVEGISKRTGEPYGFTQVSVLTDKAGICVVTLGDRLPVPTEGDTVDYSVNVTVNGSRLRVSAFADNYAVPASLTSVS